MSNPIAQQLGVGAKRSNEEKWLDAFVYTLFFLIISSRPTYRIVNGILSAIVRMFGGSGYFYFANADGLPTTVGFLVHVLVFFLVVRGAIEMRLEY
jgi:hypothetical protein